MRNTQIKEALGDYLRCQNVDEATVGAALAAADKVLDALRAVTCLIPADSAARDEVQQGAANMLAMLSEAGGSHGGLDEMLDAYYNALCDLIAA